MSSRSYDVRTEFGAFEHAVLAIAAIVAAFAVLPGLVCGVLLLVSVRGVAAARGQKPPVWLLPLLASGGLLFVPGHGKVSEGGRGGPRRWPLESPPVAKQVPSPGC